MKTMILKSPGPVIISLLLAVFSTTFRLVAQENNSAEKVMNSLGKEGKMLVRSVGKWEVTETVINSPNAIPIYNRKLIAERKMIGTMLQEIIRPAPGSKYTDFHRIYYLNYNRVEGHWEYVSIDTRAPVGLMPAWSFDHGEKGKIALSFKPFAISGGSSKVTGQLLRMDEIISDIDKDHNFSEERFILADGTGKSWTARRYDYIRIK